MIMSSLQQALNNEVENQEEQKLAEKLFISMMGNPDYTKAVTPDDILEDAFQLAKEFKAECKDRYEN